MKGVPVYSSFGPRLVKHKICNRWVSGSTPAFFLDGAAGGAATADTGVGAGFEDDPSQPRNLLKPNILTTQSHVQWEGVQVDLVDIHTYHVFPTRMHLNTIKTKTHTQIQRRMTRNINVNTATTHDKTTSSYNSLNVLPRKRSRTSEIVTVILTHNDYTKIK